MFKLPLVLIIFSCWQGQFLLASPWPKLKVSVCYNLQDREGLLDKKKVLSLYRHLRDSVNNQFTATRTRISFVSWHSCAVASADIQFDLRVHPTDVVSFVSGMSSVGKVKNRSSYTIVSLNLNHALPLKGRFSLHESIVRVALHEFMHAAGLRHEDAGEDSLLNSEFLKDPKGEYYSQTELTDSDVQLLRKAYSQVYF